MPRLIRICKQRRDHPKLSPFSPPGAHRLIPELAEDAIVPFLPTQGFLPAYVRWAMTRNDGHAIYHVATALSMLASTAHVDLCYAPNSRTYANIYALCIGTSTDSRKTTAISMGMAILAEALPDAAQAQPDSKQGLIKSLGRKQRQLVAYPEFGDALATWQQSYALPIKTSLTSVYDGTPISRGTSKELDVIPKPRLSLICGGAPEFLEAHSLEVDWRGGFLARFALFLGARERTIELDQIGVLNPADVARFTAMLRERRRDGDRPSVGRCLGFAEDTRQMMNEWQAWQKNFAAGVNTLIKASIGRANDLIPKVAMILAWDSGRARRGLDFTLGADEVSFAIRLAKHHCYSAMIVQRDIAASKDMQDRRRVLNTISTNPLKPTPLYMIIREAKLLDKRVLDILRSLKAERIIEGVPVREDRGGVIIEADWYFSLESQRPFYALATQISEKVASESMVPPTLSTLDTFEPPPESSPDIDSDLGSAVVSMSAFRARASASQAASRALAASDSSLDGPSGEILSDDSRAMNDAGSSDDEDDAANDF